MTEPTVSDAIFDLVKDYLTVPIAEGATCDNTFPAAPDVPVAGFSEVLGISIPATEDYIIHPVSTDGTNVATPVAPGYSATHADIATIALSAIAGATYGAYTLPATLPDDDAGIPDTNYPEAAMAAIERYAGLDDTLTAPSVSVGTTPTFLDIPSLDYDLSTIDMLDETIPAAPDLPDIDLVSNPDKLVLSITPALDDAIDKGLEGTQVLSHEAQRIMIDRASRPLDKKYQDATRAAFDASAARGFAETNGPLVEVLTDLAYEASYADREPFEAMRSETYQRGLKQLTAAVKSALKLEAANVAVHLEYAEKLVEVLRFNVAQQLAHANLLVTMFNEYLKVVKIIIAAYEDYVSTKLAEYQAATEVIDSETAVLDTNAAKVSVYEAQAGTVDTQAKIYTLETEQGTHPIEEFKNYVSGILKNVNIARTNIEAYQQATRAFAKAIDGQRARISGYAEQVRATGSATGVYEANWDVYSAAEGAVAASHDARRSWYGSSLQALSKEIQTFSTAAGSQRTYLRSLTDMAQANSSLYGQYASAVGAVLGYEKTYNRHSVALQEAASNIELATEDATVRMDALEAQATAVQESINIGLQAAKATTAAGCAQAAYSMRSISAGMRAGASMSDAGSDSNSWSKNESIQRSYDYRKTRSIDV